jgi:hypothetical protein
MGGASLWHKRQSALPFSLVFGCFLGSFFASSCALVRAGGGEQAESASSAHIEIATAVYRARNNLRSFTRAPLLSLVSSLRIRLVLRETFSLRARTVSRPTMSETRRRVYWETARATTRRSRIFSPRTHRAARDLPARPCSFEGLGPSGEHS